MCYNQNMNQEELLKKVKNELPNTSGVYIMKNVSSEVIYVGKAKSLKRRVKSYFDDTPKTQKTYAYERQNSSFISSSCYNVV